MLILLPPSETKAPGGTGPALSLASLSWPELTATRSLLLERLVAVSQDVVAARRALGVTVGQDAEIERNTRVRTAPTRPALRRYTGVLYDALDYPSLPPAARARADRSLVIASALFGLLRGTDPVPAYRLSAASRLPDLPPLAQVWRPLLVPLLAAESDWVLDLRSGAYAALAPVPGAITVQVVTSAGLVVSHHNKQVKGHLVRALVSSRAAIPDVRALRRVAKTAGLPLIPVNETTLRLTV